MSGNPTSYTYSLLTVPQPTTLILRSDGTVIPQDPNNPDYTAFVNWTAAGNLVPSAPEPPLAARTATTLQMNGLAVTSTATAALNGTYACDPQTLYGLQSECNAILLNDTFADGSTSLAWPDKSGASHTFTVAQFRTLISAIAQFVAACTLYAGGATTTLPATSATIP